MKNVNKYSALFNDSMRQRDVMRITHTAIDAVPADERGMFIEACIQAEKEADERERKKYAHLKGQGYIVCTEY